MSAWAGQGNLSKTIGTRALASDPFYKPQGLNSVFDTDQSTLAVIAQANEKVATLAK